MPAANYGSAFRRVQAVRAGSPERKRLRCRNKTANQALPLCHHAPRSGDVAVPVAVRHGLRAANRTGNGPGYARRPAPALHPHLQKPAQRRFLDPERYKFQCRQCPRPWRRPMRAKRWAPRLRTVPHTAPATPRKGGAAKLSSLQYAWRGTSAWWGQWFAWSSNLVLVLTHGSATGGGLRHGHLQLDLALHTLGVFKDQG